MHQVQNSPVLENPRMNSLPFEICSSIFSYLSPEELISLRQCSKWHYFLIGSDLIFGPILRKSNIVLDHQLNTSALNAYIKYSKSRKRILCSEPNVIKWSAHLLGVPYMAKSSTGIILFLRERFHFSWLGWKCSVTY